jgi:hypothetical protein
LGDVGEAGEGAGPSARTVDACAHAGCAAAVLLDMVVLEAHSGVVRIESGDGDRDLALPRRIEINGPVALHVPCKHEPRKGLKCEAGAPLVLASVGVEVVAAAADHRLDADDDDAAVPDVMLE